MKLRGYIVDTTLRDGEQSAGIAFSKEDKVRLALKMDDIGIHQIEVGMPALAVSEAEAVEEIMTKRKRSIISAWSPMKKETIQLATCCKPDIVHISVPVSYVQIYTILKKNKQWLRNQLIECISYAREEAKEVTVGFEDASRADISFVVSLAMQLQELGVKRIRYADTVGVLAPHQVGDIVRSLKHYTDLDIEMHVHNDFGLAVANSIEAVKSGAKYIDCTFMGIGERAGNCDFLKLIKASEAFVDFGVTKHAIFEVQKEVIGIIKSSSK